MKGVHKVDKECTINGLKIKINAIRVKVRHCSYNDALGANKTNPKIRSGYNSRNLMHLRSRDHKVYREP